MLFDVTLASALQSKGGSETHLELDSLWRRRRSGWGARNRAHLGVPGKLWGRPGAGNTARTQLRGVLQREPRDPWHSWSARPTVASSAGSETPCPLWCGVAPASELGAQGATLFPSLRMYCGRTTGVGCVPGARQPRPTRTGLIGPSSSGCRVSPHRLGCLGAVVPWTCRTGRCWCRHPSH